MSITEPETIQFAGALPPELEIMAASAQPETAAVTDLDGNKYVTVDPQADPTKAQSIANQAMHGEDAPIIAPRPPVDVIELPAGWVDRDGVLHKKVRIREMNGYDEEELARPAIKTVMDFVNLIVKRCTVDIDGRGASDAMLNELLIGDRDAIVLGVRVATFGPTFNMPVLCPSCEHRFEVMVDIEKDIPIKELPGSATDHRREVRLRDGRPVVLNVMNGAAQRTAYGNEMNDAEQASIMLHECVYSIGGEAVTRIDQIKALGTDDRRRINKCLEDNTCGPQWQAVMQTCPNCQVENALPINLIALFLD